MFLDALLPLEQRRVWMAGRYWFKDDQHNQWPSSMVEQCQRCRQILEDACIQKGVSRWHVSCFNCARCHRPLATELHHSRLIMTGPQGEVLLCCEICTERSIPRRNVMENDEEKQGFDEHNKEECARWVSQLEQCLSRVKAALARLHGVLPGTYIRSNLFFFFFFSVCCVSHILALVPLYSTRPTRRGLQATSNAARV